MKLLTTCNQSNVATAIWACTISALISPLTGCGSQDSEAGEPVELRSVTQELTPIGVISYNGMLLRFDRMNATGLDLSNTVGLTACDTKTLYAVEQEVTGFDLYFSNDSGESFTRVGSAWGPEIACDHGMLAALDPTGRLYTKLTRANGSVTGTWNNQGQVGEVDRIQGGDGTFYGVKLGSPGNNSVLTATNRAWADPPNWGNSIATVGAVLVTGTGGKSTGSNSQTVWSSLAWPHRAFALEASGTISYNDELLEGGNSWTWLNTGNERYFTLSAAATSDPTDPENTPNVLFGLQDRNNSGNIELNRIRITENNCDDGLDNDANGLTDHEDWACEQELADDWCASHANGTYCAARYQEPDWFRDQWNVSSSMVTCSNGVATSIEPGYCQQSGSNSDFQPDFEDDMDITVPSGFGRWCNAHWPSGGWALGFGSNATTPCENFVAAGGTVVRSGLYSLSGKNNVLANCTDGAMVDAGNGEAPIQNVYNTVGDGTNRCVFTISPDTLPVFERMFYNFHLIPGRQTSGFTHDTNPSINRFGVQCDGANPCIGETAHDHPLNEGRPVRAVGPGRVLLVNGSRDRDLSSTQTCTGTPNQGEIYVEHNVGSHTYYSESFVAYYAHLRKRLVVSGQTVTTGQILGYVGGTGCTGSQTHLHTGVFRLSNVNAQQPGYPGFGWRLHGYFQANDGPTGNTVGNATAIDPLGWAGPGFDPWGHSERNTWTSYGFTGLGAWSINLFKSGHAFPYP